MGTVTLNQARSRSSIKNTVLAPLKEMTAPAVARRE